MANIYGNVRTWQQLVPDNLTHDVSEMGLAEFIDFGCYLSGGVITVYDSGANECVWEDDDNVDVGCKFEYLDENDVKQCDDKCAPFNAHLVMTDEGFYCEYENFTYGKETREMKLRITAASEGYTGPPQ